MDAVKRSRFASKQMKAGPAPLASFEDLPSDELESPEDFSIVKTYDINFDDESGSRDLQFTTPDSLTISSQSTPRIECDFDSQFTLTPGEYQGQSTSELRTASLSSLSKEDSGLNVKQKKGSAVSLSTLETTEVEYTHRKSSWTDIFRSHNQNSAKTSVISELDSNEKSSKRKSKTDQIKNSDTKSKDKGKFLSIFKKKSSKQIISPVSPENYILPNETLNVSECLNNLPEDVKSKLSNGKISKGKENESPIEKEVCLTPCEIQNDLGKVNSDRCDKIPDERRLGRKVINIAEKSFEKEYNILSQQIDEKKVDKVSKTDTIQAIVDIEEIIESSESELTFETKDTPVEKKEDDFEAEILLPHDSSEIDDDPIIESQTVTFEVSKQVVLPSRQQRLEITTKPIDRPRSTTPINVAPLEAFIQSVSPTFDSKVEKIKLSLPGEQFIGRIKSPKKSSMKSWADFCERGLHSPRMHKRIDKDSQRSPFDSLDSTVGLSNTQVSCTDNWAAFESDFTSTNANIFIDNFKPGSDTDVITSEEFSKDVCDSCPFFESRFNSSSSETYACASCSKINSDIHSAGMPVTSTHLENCSCQCHLEKKSDVTNQESCNNISNFGASKFFNIVTDEQF